MGIVVSLAWALLPQAVDHQAVRKAVRAFVGKDADARREGQAYLEGLSSTNGTWIGRSAADEGIEAAAALRAWLPHPLWWGIVQGTIGEVRRRERELLGEGGPRGVGDFARAAAGLLGRDGPDRLIGLKILERVPVPDPAVLRPWLDAADPATRRAALLALARVDAPAALAAARRRLGDASDDLARVAADLVGELGSSEATPALLEELRAHPGRAGILNGALRKIGDGRAEEPLIGALREAPERERYDRIDALAQVGGAKAVAALRTYRDGLPAADPRREWAERGLRRLRDPELLREDLAAGRWSRESFRVGDARLAGEVAAAVRAGAFKIKDRNAALEYVGLFGSGEQLDLLLEHLKDDRFKTAAAVALGELGDPRAAKPLATALGTADYGRAIASALGRLPLEEARGPLLEILEDPEASRSAVQAAIVLAGKAGGDALRKRLLELVVDRNLSIRWGTSAARAVAPLLRPEDLESLRSELGTKGTSRTMAVELALAQAGDRTGVDALLRRWTDGGAHELPDLDPELVLRAEPEGWVERLEASIKTRPDWVAPLVLLAAKKRPQALEALRKHLGSSNSAARRQAAAALAATGDPKDVARIVENEDYAWNGPLERKLAAGMDEATAAALRERAWGQAYYINQGPARLLALRRDAAMAPFFKRGLAREYGDNEVVSHTNVPAMAEALAALGDREAATPFRRMLRSTAPGRRALGARCLAQLEGAASIPDLIPLLDDGEEVPADRLNDPDALSPGRVRDLAAAALETLAPAPFRETGRARVEAARAWALRRAAEK